MKTAKEALAVCWSFLAGVAIFIRKKVQVLASNCSGVDLPSTLEEN